MKAETFDAAISALRTEEISIIGMMDGWSVDSSTYKRCEARLLQSQAAIADLTAERASPQAGAAAVPLTDAMPLVALTPERVEALLCVLQIAGDYAEEHWGDGWPDTLPEHGIVRAMLGPLQPRPADGPNGASE